MIKGGLGYLKYLKLFGTLFLISCFMGLGVNSVNAIWGTVVSVQSTVNSSYDNSYSMLVNGQGLFLTQYVGAGKQLLMSAPGRYFMWINLNGVSTPYIGNNTFAGNSRTWHEEGVPDDYLLCDELSVSDTAPSGCISQVYSDNVGVVSRIFQKLDKRYYGTFTEDSLGGWQGNLVCFSSSTYSRSVCFYSCTHTNCGLSSSDKIGGVSPHKNLSNSQNLGVNFDSIPINILTSFPGSALVNGGSQTVDGDYQYTGDVVVNSCSKQKALTWYGCQGYVKDMCFSSYENNTDIFDGNPVGAFAIPGQDIASVYSATRYLRRGGITGDSFDYGEWFGYWRNTYNVYKNSNGAINNPFIGVPVGLFTLMGNVDSYGLPYNNSSIVEFCTLALYTQDLSASYTGVAYNVVCNMSPIELVDCSLAIEIGGGGVGGVGSTGTIGPIGSSWDGITNRSGYHDKPGGNVVASLQNYQDGKSFENSFFNMLKDNFKYPTSSGSPLLPTYIIIAMCGLILFRFLSH